MFGSPESPEEIVDNKNLAEAKLGGDDLQTPMTTLPWAVHVVRNSRSYSIVWWGREVDVLFSCFPSYPSPNATATASGNGWCPAQTCITTCHWVLGWGHTIAANSARFSPPSLSGPSAGLSLLFTIPRAHSFPLSQIFDNTSAERIRREEGPVPGLSPSHCVISSQSTYGLRLLVRQNPSLPPGSESISPSMPSSASEFAWWVSRWSLRLLLGHPTVSLACKPLDEGFPPLG